MLWFSEQTNWTRAVNLLTFGFSKKDLNSSGVYDIGVFDLERICLLPRILLLFIFFIFLFLSNAELSIKQGLQL